MKRLSFLCALALSGLLACSCTEDAERTDASDHASGTPVNRSIEVATLPIEHVVTSPSTRGGASADEMVTLDYGAATRAASSSDKTAAESKIHSLYILQFEGTAGGSKLLKKSEDLSAKLAAGNGKVDFEFAANGATNRVYVVANMDVSGYTVDNTTLKAFEEGVVAFTPATEVPASGLPMVSKAQDFNPLTDAPGTFSLKTPLAKLTFSCDFLGDVTTGDDLRIQLKNVPSGYWITSALLSAGDASQQPASGVTYTGTLDLLASKTSAVTCYFSANLAGRNTKLEKTSHRNSVFAPKDATYVEITGTIKGQAGSRFYLALGDGTAQDFNVASNSAYTITATIKGINEISDLRVGTIIDLNAQLDNKTANCYIVTESNKRFAIDATVMGNGATTPAHTASSVSGDANFSAITPSALDPHSAAVLWQTNNTASYNGDVVSPVLMLVAGKLIFKTTENEGNAVVAAYGSNDGTGDVIWSWHIWRTNSEPKEKPLKAIGTVTADGALVMMDRNLGALSATPQDNLSIGLLYQWGRKDPFPGGVDLEQASSVMVTFPSGIPAVTAGGSLVTPADAVKNPGTIYISSDVDWTRRNDNLWGTPITGTVVINNGDKDYTFNSNKGSKSIYDPCPVGWRVPPAYAFANARKTTLNKGYSVPIGTGNADHWFPASDYWNSVWDTFGLSAVGSYGYYWTSSANVNSKLRASILYFSDISMYPVSNSGRANGNSLRCVKE